MMVSGARDSYLVRFVGFVEQGMKVLNFLNFIFACVYEVVNWNRGVLRSVSDEIEQGNGRFASIIEGIGLEFQVSAKYETREFWLIKKIGMVLSPG